MTEHKGENSINQERRELWERMIKAIREKNRGELAEAEAEWWATLERTWNDEDSERSYQTNEFYRVWGTVEQREPNLARCIIATMEELKDIGLWDEETNSTLELAGKALQAYNALEKRRTDLLSAMKAYARAYNYHRLEETKLAFNLIKKDLTPLRETINNPLKWYLDTDHIVELCKVSSGVEITVPTLRKYQRLGLLIKPIRLGRRAYYSILTVFRVLIIDQEKKRGVNLRDLKPTMETAVKAALQACFDKYPDDRTEVEDGFVIMNSLTSPVLEKVCQASEWIEASDEFFSKFARKSEEEIDKANQDN